MTYIKQLIGEIRQHPLSIWLSIAGTALAIFMIMVMFIRNNLDTVDAAPESKRSSMLIGRGMHVAEIDGSRSTSGDGIRRQWIEKIYENLDGVKDIAYFRAHPSNMNLSLNNGVPQDKKARMTDANYWRVLNFDFVSGRPFTDAECESRAEVVIITDNVAREFFKTTDVIGKTIDVNRTPHRIVGVVKEVNPLFQLSYADLYRPIFDYGDINEIRKSDFGRLSQFLGEHNVILIKEPGVSDRSIQDQVVERYNRLNRQIMRDSIQLIYHGAPYNVETSTVMIPSEGNPDTSEKHRRNLLIYGILLLVPAINLSGISRSRLSKRISEIGVRRAFGATRMDIILQLLGENFLVTIVGGIIGLGLSLLFVGLFSYLFIPTDNTINMGEVFHPSLGMLVNWQTFVWALCFCFILNVLSAGVAVWQAARIAPAEAIGKK